MDETLDWMDKFDDSVFTDIIEANDSSALTDFENTETETESPLEADETETTSTSEGVTKSNNNFFKYLTPTISRAAGPSSMNNDAHSKGDKPSSKSSKKTTVDDDDDIDIDTYYGGRKTDGDDDDDDDYGSWTDKDREKAAKEVADAAGKEAAAAATKVKLAYQNAEDAEKDFYKKNATAEKLKAKSAAAINGIKSGEGTGSEKSKKAHEAIEEAANTYGENSEEYKQAVAAAKEVDMKELEDLAAALDKSAKDLVQAVNNAEAAVKAVEDAKSKAQEAFDRAQSAKEYAGTLAAEAKEAFDRAQEKQKEWEQEKKQKELEDAEIAGKSDSDNNTSTDINSAINNNTTFDLSKALAKAGAKMTKTEYKQVADFVADYPGLASFIDGGLTNVEKSAVGNVVAGIQAINTGNYLTAVKEFAQAFGMTLVATFQLLATKAYGLGPRILGIIKSFMENKNINYNSHDKDFETFKEMRDGYDGDSSELMALYKTAKGTTDQKQTFDYMKNNVATNVGEYNEGLVEDVNKVVSDASRKVIHYSPYVLEAVKKWR